MRNLTANDLIAAYKKWKENTSTSPKGNHLGHYKVWLRDYEEEQGKPKQDPHKKRTHLTTQEFFQIQANKSNMCT